MKQEAVQFPFIIIKAYTPKSKNPIKLSTVLENDFGITTLTRLQVQEGVY